MIISENRNLLAKCQIFRRLGSFIQYYQNELNGEDNYLHPLRIKATSTFIFLTHLMIIIGFITKSIILLQNYSYKDS